MIKTKQHYNSTSVPGIQELAKQYRQPLVRHFVRRGLTIDVAEDCAQEVFVRMASVDLAMVDTPQAYLFTVASSVQIDHARRLLARGAGKHDQLEKISLPSGEPSPARVFEGREALEKLNRALLELPARTREVFLLNRLDGLSYTQLGIRYGVNVGSIEKRIAKALLHLRNRFSDDE